MNARSNYTQPPPYKAPTLPRRFWRRAYYRFLILALAAAVFATRRLFRAFARSSTDEELMFFVTEVVKRLEEAGVVSYKKGPDHQSEALEKMLGNGDFVRDLGGGYDN